MSYVFKYDTEIYDMLGMYFYHNAWFNNLKQQRNDIKDKKAKDELAYAIGVNLEYQHEIITFLVDRYDCPPIRIYLGQVPFRANNHIAKTFKQR